MTGASDAGGVRTLVVMPPALRATIFGAEAWQRLERAGAVDVLDLPGDREALLAAIGLADALVTSWGQVPVDDGVLARAPRLALVAHAGASVKHVVTPALFARGVRVTQAGQAMARPVAEVALAFTLAMLHRTHRFDHALRTGRPWAEAAAAPPRHEIAGSTIGVVGASRTGRAFIPMLRALGATVLVSDPYLKAEDAAALGVQRVTLEELLQASRVTVLHAPSLPETRHLIGARELALMPDDAALVNVARSWLVDEGALLAELRTGRLDAALDVYDDEPLPATSPFRTLPNVLLTPHQAAGTLESRRRLGDIVVEEVAAFAAGRPLSHEVTADMLTRMG